MAVVERSPQAPPEWETLWNQDPRATLFLHPRWMNAITRGFPGYRPLYLTARQEGRLVAMIPVIHYKRYGFRQFVSMPFGGHGGPLTVPDAGPEVISALALAYRKMVQGFLTMRFEVSIFDPNETLIAALDPVWGEFRQDFRTHLIDLGSGIDNLWNSGYRAGTRKSVRAAERNQVMVELDRSSQALAILDQLHSAQGIAWSGVDPYPLSVITAMLEAFGEKARIYVASSDGEPVAACLLVEEGSGIYPLVSGAADRARSLRAFHLLIHVALREACARGLQTWHFGGSGGNADIEFFKESFGGRAVSVLRYHHIARWVRRLRPRPAWDR